MSEQVNGLIIAIVPKKAFENWLRETFKFFEVVPDEEAFKHLDEESLLYLIPWINNPEDCINFIKEHYLELFRNSLTLWCKDERGWPKDLSYERFNEFFTVEFHTHIYDVT